MIHILIIFSAKILQVVHGHFDIVMCISRSECNLNQDCYVITGSKDCTVMVWMFTSRNQAIIGDNGSKYQYGDLWQISFEKELKNQGIPQQPSTGQIASLIPFFSPLLCFKNENVKVKVKYGFVLHTGLSFAL
jgi:hypothetical protein